MSNLAKIKQLRQSTGAGFKDCNTAINESNGDLNKAVEILRIKGISKASKKMSRDAKEGVVALSGDQNKTSIIEVNCETDFVAKNEDFINFVKELSEINNFVNSDLSKLSKSIMKNKITVEDNLVSMIAKIGEKITLGRARTINHENSKNYFYLHTIIKDNLSKIAVIASINTKEKSEKIDIFGKQLSMHIAASNPISINSEEITQEILDKEQELITEELKNSGKPEDIAKKISSGKMNKFKEENSLMNQQWVMEPKKKVKNIIDELGIKDLKIIDFYRIKIGD
jgi:elongation factor Ts